MIKKQPKPDPFLNKTGTWEIYGFATEYTEDSITKLFGSISKVNDKLTAEVVRVEKSFRELNPGGKITGITLRSNGYMGGRITINYGIPNPNYEEQKRLYDEYMDNLNSLQEKASKAGREQLLRKEIADAEDRLSSLKKRLENLSE